MKANASIHLELCELEVLIRRIISTLADAEVRLADQKSYGIWSDLDLDDWENFIQNQREELRHQMERLHECLRAILWEGSNMPMDPEYPTWTKWWTTVLERGDSVGQCHELIALEA